MADDILTLIDDFNDEIRRFLQEHTVCVTSASSLGLDTRAGSQFYVNEHGITVDVCYRRRLDYYGGFEYVDSDCVVVMGDFVTYSAEDERVLSAIERFYDLEKA